MGEAKESSRAAEEAWWRSFLENLKPDYRRSGREAMRNLCGAGLGRIVRVLFYNYHRACADALPAKVSERLGDIKDSLKYGLEKLKRAKKVAREKQKDPRAHMFKERLEKAARNLANAPWPFENPKVKTFADAKDTYSVIDKLQHHLDQSLEVLGVGRQSIERYGGKPLLAILWAIAEARGVPLSLTALVQLADAAHETEPPLDINTLRCFLKHEDIKLWVGMLQEHFEGVFRRMNLPKPLIIRGPVPPDT